MTPIKISLTKEKSEVINVLSLTVLVHSCLIEKLNIHQYEIKLVDRHDAPLKYKYLLCLSKIKLTDFRMIIYLLVNKQNTNDTDIIKCRPIKISLLRLKLSPFSFLVVEMT